MAQGRPSSPAVQLVHSISRGIGELVAQLEGEAAHQHRRADLAEQRVKQLLVERAERRKRDEVEADAKVNCAGAGF